MDYVERGQGHHGRWPRAATLLLLVLAAPALQAADPVRGAGLYTTPPRPGLLVCVDCHGENPQANNFGNIFSGHNAVALIQRAIRSNTGGMGYFGALYDETDLADIAAYLGNAPTSLEFPPTASGATSAVKTVTVSASTKTALGDFSARTEGDFVIVASRCGDTVPRFSTCGIDVAFRPRAAGVRSGKLLIAHDGLSTPVSIELSGEASARPPALARVAPALWVFADTAVGLNSATRNITLHNDSDEPLALAAIGATPADFVVVGGSCVAGSVLPPHQRCSIGLRFEPRAGGAYAGELLLVHDGQGGGSQVALSGQASAGGMARLRADAPALDFGVTEPATRTPSRTLGFVNEGTLTWHGAEVLSSDPSFVVEAGTCTAAVAPRQSCQVAVSFTPNRTGTFSGELQLRAPGAPLLRVSLAGRALASAGRLQAVPARLSFDGVPGGEQTLTLVNRGNGALQLRALELSGADAADFSLATGSGCAAGAVLQAGSGCRVGVRRRDGASAGVARLEVAHDAAAEPLDVDLVARATSAEAALWVDAVRVPFPDTHLGTSGPTSLLRLHNRGAVALRWAVLQLSGDHAGDFALDFGEPAGEHCSPDRALAAGASCAVGLRFAPRVAGARTASLVLRATDAAQSTVVTLAGHAVVDARPRLQADTLTLRLSPRGPGSASAPPPVVVSNRGSAMAVALRWRTEGPYRVVTASGCAAGLAPGQRCSVIVERDPARLGTGGGWLWVEADGAEPLHVALEGESVFEAPGLVWVGVPASAGDATLMPTTAVGNTRPSAEWALVNHGNAASAPLRWAWHGAAAGDFSVDPDSACMRTSVLLPGASCTLRLWFHPAAAAVREARLAVGGATLALKGQGLAAAAQLALLPAAINFAAGPGLQPELQAAWLRNEGPALLRVDAAGSRTAAFSSAPAGAEACPNGVFDLLPGDACSVDVAWLGGADGRAGGALSVMFDDGAGSAQVPLTVSEDPAQATNVGGGGALGAPSLLALAAAALLLCRRRPGVRTDHD